MSEIPLWAKVEADELIGRAISEAGLLIKNSMGASEKLHLAYLLKQLVNEIDRIGQQRDRAVTLLGNLCVKTSPDKLQSYRHCPVCYGGSVVIDHRYIIKHTDDCAWLLIRQFLDELKESTDGK